MEDIDRALRYNPNDFDPDLDDETVIVRNYNILVDAYRELRRESNEDTKRCKHHMEQWRKTELERDDLKERIDRIQALCQRAAWRCF